MFRISPSILFEGAFLSLENEDKLIEGRISRPAVQHGDAVHTLGV